MVRILLINPPFVRKGGNIWKSVMGVLPPQALAILGALLEQQGHQVKILDAPALQLDLLNFSSYIQDHYDSFDPQFIGITMTTLLAELGYEIAAACKSMWPEVKIVAGGVHPTAEPEDVLSHSAIDYVVRDEGEYAFTELVAGKQPNTILGMSYRDEKKANIHTPQRPWIRKLDDLPLPAYHLLPMDRYKPSVGTYKRLPAISMVVSRGCPGKCTFCYQPYGALVRQRSAIKIFEEVKLLVERYGLREICFYDDNFCTYKENVEAFCNLMITYAQARKKKVYWSCFSRVDWIQESTIKLMKEAGCHRIMFGVESANEAVLRNIKKNINLDQVRKVHALIRQEGIDTHATFMFGNPGETEESIKQTISFALALNPTIAQFNILAPNPGTEVYRWAKEQGYLTSTFWQDYDLYTPILQLPTISSSLLQKYYRKAFKSFYLRPSYILNRIIRFVSDPIEGWYTLQGLRAVMGL